ncbi:MAG: ABC transporter substrate-binding protein [Candidatus Thorarchaeota archaeon]
MSLSNSRSVLSLIFLTLLASSFVLQPQSIAIDTPSSQSESIIAQANEYQVFHGGTVEAIRIVEYDTLTQALNALDTGEADIFGHRINESDYSVVSSYSNIQESWAYSNQAYLLSANAKFYPLNNQYLRRAIAYAINKTDIEKSAMGGFVDSLDFAVPLYSEYSIEDTEGGIYYNSNAPEAIKELAKAGMLDVDEDGVVEGPDGSEVVLPIWYPTDITGLNETASIISSNLLDVGINNTLVPMYSSDIQSEVSNHNQAYGLALYRQTLSQYGYDWVATTFHSIRMSIPGQNIANIYNQDLNNIAEEYLDQVDLIEAEMIGREAMLLVRNLCPVIPLFTYRWLSVYTDSNFDSWVEDHQRGALSLWNPVSVSAKTGSSNELVVAVLPRFFDVFMNNSLNPFFGNNTLDQEWLEGDVFNPYLLVYDTPIATAPDGRPVPRHATSWEMQFLGIVPDLTSNQSRVSFYCDPNANWTDGEQIDAQDYRFTFNLYKNRSLIPAGYLIDSVKVTGDYIAGVDYENKDMFLYRRFGRLPILAEHIWKDLDPFTWNPTPDQIIGSGPYEVSGFTPGVELVLTANDNYYPEIDIEPPTLRSLVIVPENPIPAESVVFRVFVDDRSRVNNVTIFYTYQIGNINFTESQLMVSDATGFEATIPSRVTATTVSWKIYAEDIWRNGALIASGYYTRTTEPTIHGIDPALALAVEVSGVAAIAIFILLFIRRRRK